KVFEYVPGAKGQILGKVTARELAIPQLQANVKDAFHGTVDLHTDEASASFMQNGDTVIDFANPLAKLKDPAWLNRPDRKLLIKQLGAAEARIELTSAPPKVIIRNAYLKGARYEEDGVLVEVEDATVPGQSVFTPTTGSIPKVDIKDAHLHLDLL